ncbi:MAG TPA: tryptophan--tRNA ligase, partial [Patescibacteria group bacterium]|nr:tryptophan--tRNA ligase [Patescibacteria group bacterium]
RKWNREVRSIKKSMNKKKVYSGMRATGSGRLHLGNYLGGAKGMLALQDDYDCVFSVVDAHAVTTPYDPSTLKSQVRNVILDYLAVGLDPEKCKLEIQSQIPQHTELAYYLSSVYPLAPLEDLPTFKEKKAQYPKNVTVALLNYPILMAADVLLYKGDLVPVGIDQEPHMEVMREIARKFNSLYGETFPEPQRFKTIGEYVPSLTGQGKMSKTVEGSSIYLADDLETIKKKLAKVPTDSGTLGGDVPKTGGVATLFTLMALFNRDDMHKKFKREYEAGNIRYGDMKAFLAEAIFAELQPIQEKRTYFEEHPEIVDQIIADGRERCLQVASETMREVKEKMGLPLA